MGSWMLRNEVPCLVRASLRFYEDSMGCSQTLLCAEARQFVTSPTWQSLGVSVYREHLLGQILGVP